MGAIDLKNIVVDAVETNDPLLLSKLVAVIEDHRRNKKDISVMTNGQKNILNERRARYESGEVKLLTWEEVKEELKEDYGL